MSAPTDEIGAVFEHTAHSAIAAARNFSAAVVADYNPARQSDAERRLAYRHNTADELSATKKG